MHTCENTSHCYQLTTANGAILLHENIVLFQENYKRFQNEQVLHNEWQNLLEKKTQLIDVIGEL